ncbi:MAG: hypothetical protein ACRDTN_12035, partial [Mycobacterium sp.]
MTASIPAEVLSARYIAIRTAEAKGLTDRLVAASRDKSPQVRRLLVPILVRFWRCDRAQGWTVLEQIAHGAVGFAGRPNPDVIELFGTISVAILNEVRHDPEGLARLGAIWRTTMDRLLNSPLTVGLRMVARGWVLRQLAAKPFANALKQQPPFQPLNYAEMQASFARTDDFRVHWRQALGCLEHPETAPAPIVETLSQPELPFDVYLMLVCERALIYYGVTSEPTVVMDALEGLFHHGVPWFRQSILYVLYHIMTNWPAVDAGLLDRYEALTLRFYRSGEWRLQTGCGNYVVANHVANPDVIAVGAGRPPGVLAQLLDAAIGERDDEQIGALFGAIDGIGFYHGDPTLALALLEHAHIAGGELVEPRVIASLASVRLLDQPLTDAYLTQHTSFARLTPELVSSTEPSVHG